MSASSSLCLKKLLTPWPGSTQVRVSYPKHIHVYSNSSRLRYCKCRGALIICWLHRLCRESHAGLEIGVASTKTYTSQVLCLIIVLVMAEDHISLQQRRSEIIQGLKQLPEMIKSARAGREGQGHC